MYSREANQGPGRSPLIDFYLSMSSERQTKEWKNRTFIEVLPQTMRLLMSPQNQGAYSVEERSKIAASFIDNLTLLSFPGPHPRSQSLNTIPVQGSEYYDIDQEIITRHNPPHQSPKEIYASLKELLFAGSIAIALTLPLEEQKKIITRLSNNIAPFNTTRENSMDATFGLLMKLSSFERQWVVKHGIDAEVWDHTLVELLTHLPKYTTTNSKAKFPLQFTQSYTHSEYSPAVMEAMLDYAAEFAENQKITSTRKTHLNLFMNEVRYFLESFRQKPHSNADIFIIKAHLNEELLRDRRITGEDLHGPQKILNDYRKNTRLIEKYSKPFTHDEFPEDA